MKTIDLTVEVKYRVGFTAEVPDDIYEILIEGGAFDDDDYRLTEEERNALEWIKNNVSEGDCNSWQCEFEQDLVAHHNSLISSSMK